MRRYDIFMVNALPTRRHYWQFSLGSAFVLVAIFALWIAEESRIVRERQALRATLLAHGAEIGPRWDATSVPALNPVRRLLGDEPAPMITLPSDCWTPSNESQGIDVENVERLFPEAQLMQFL